MQLSSRFFGTYEIIGKIDPMAYRLALPPGSRIHNVFHVSMLRKHIGPVTSVTEQLPLTDEVNLTTLPQPEAVLDRRVVKKGSTDPRLKSWSCGRKPLLRMPPEKFLSEWLVPIPTSSLRTRILKGGEWLEVFFTCMDHTLDYVGYRKNWSYGVVDGRVISGLGLLL